VRIWRYVFTPLLARLAFCNPGHPRYHTPLWIGFWCGVAGVFPDLDILRCFGITLSTEPRIRPYLLWLALSVATASHVLEDYLWGSF